MQKSGFGTRLKAMRDAAGLTQQQLADAASLSLPTFRHWEQGQREPSWPNVVALADALGVSCDDFRPDGKAGRKGKGKMSDG
jgi:transcriptional regulator with XRE-family HTH domain